MKKIKKTVVITSLLIAVSLTVFIAVSLTSCISITHGPYLQNVSADEATIVWTTNRKAISWIELTSNDKDGEQPGQFFAAKNGTKSEGRVHAVKINRLDTGARYSYRVCSKRVIFRVAIVRLYGKKVAASNFHSFVTLDPAKDSITFTMVNDIHNHSDVLERLLKLSNPPSNDMYFFNGDMIEWMRSERALFSGFMDVSVKLFASEIPMYYVKGNHETRGGEFASHFQDYFSPLAEPYGLIRHGHVCFVTLDSGEDKNDSHPEYFGNADFDNYRSQQAEWLRKALKSETFTGAPFKVAVCHIPPSNGGHGSSEVMNKFVPLLNEAGIDLMLCGHYHSYYQWKANSQVHFPIIINANNTFVKASATSKSLVLDVFNLDGKMIDRMTVNK
jgi:predicted phosphodiesterase